MKFNAHPGTEFYYTYDHEWACFSGELAFAGIAPFKLIGIPHIDYLQWNVPVNSELKQGQLAVTLYHREYAIPVHCPVEGRLLSVNKGLQEVQLDYIKISPQDKGWLFAIRTKDQQLAALLTADQYYKRTSPLTERKRYCL